MSPYINLSIDFLVKIPRQNIGKAIYFSGAQRGISPVERYVKRALSGSYNSINFCFQVILIFRFLKYDPASYLVSLILRKSIVKEALPAFSGSLPSVTVS